MGKHSAIFQTLTSAFRNLLVERSDTPEPAISDHHKWKEAMISKLRSTTRTICNAYGIKEIQPAYLNSDIQYPQKVQVWLGILFQCNKENIHETWSKLLQHVTIDQHCLIHAVLSLALTLWCLVPTIEKKDYFKDMKNETIDAHFEQCKFVDVFNGCILTPAVYGPDAFISTASIRDPTYVLPILFKQAEADAMRMADEMQQYLPLFIPDIGAAAKHEADHKQVWRLPMQHSSARESESCRWADISREADTGQSMVYWTLHSLFEAALKWRYEAYLTKSKEYQFTFPAFTEPFYTLTHVRKILKEPEKGFPHHHVLLGLFPLIREKTCSRNGGWGEWQNLSAGAAIMMPAATEDIPPPVESESDSDMFSDSDDE